MASGLSHQIRCPVCWSDLKDPVCLPCEHFYCRTCITDYMNRNDADPRCPECRNPFTRNDVKVNRVLRNLVDAAKEHLREHQALKESVISVSTGNEARQQDFTEDCIHHIEKLKLFCVTDQKPICVVCKEDETHLGHTFKTLNDAFHDIKQKTSEALETLFSVEGRLINLVNEQAEEILKTMEKSRTLSEHISDQFMKLHNFLNDKERELKETLEEEKNQNLSTIGDNMFAMEEMLSDVGTKQGIVMSALEMKQPTQFLQWWNENGHFVNREMFKIMIFRNLTLHDLTVIPDTLSLGIYEAYLQFVVWKEMLRCIESVPHHHTVEDKGDQGITISPSGRSIQPKKVGKIHKNKLGSVWLNAMSSFNTGKHFWEVDVGKKVDWGVGICSCESGKVVNDTVLCFNLQSGYHIQQTQGTDKRTVTITSGPRKIGVYLDCVRNQVSFYNTDQMTLIDTRVLSKPSPHSLCLSSGLYLDGKNSDPLTIFWY